MGFKLGQEVIDKIRGKKHISPEHLEPPTHHVTEINKMAVLPNFSEVILGGIILDKIRPQINKLKNNVDENSIKVIDETVEKLIDSLTCKSDPVRFLKGEQAELAEQYSENLKEIKSKYPLPDADHRPPEVFHYHHGLRFASSKIKDYIKKKDFLDIGAYIGDSAVVLKEYTSEKIFSFEFLPNNTALFKETMALNNVPKDKIILVPMAVSKDEGKIRVNDYGGGGVTIDRHLSSSLIPVINREVVANTISIDKFADDNNLNIGFIKADVEGVALDVIKGAVKTIKRDRPVLSIGIYHTVSELFDVKPFIEDIVSDYVFEFQTMNFSPLYLSELTLFAYPKEIFHV